VTLAHRSKNGRVPLSFGEGLGERINRETYYARRSAMHLYVNHSVVTLVQKSKHSRVLLSFGEGLGVRTKQRRFTQNA